MSSAQPSEGSTVSVARIVVGTAALIAIIALAIWFLFPMLKSGPGAAAEEFLAAVAERDLPAARARVTEGGQHLQDSDLEAVLDEGATFAIGEVREMGNSANVQYTVDGQRGQMLLVLENGEWRISGTAEHDLSAPFTHELGEEEAVARDFLTAVISGDVEGARKLLTVQGQQSGESLLAEHIAEWERRQERGGAMAPAPHLKTGDGDEITVRGRYVAPNLGVISTADNTGGGGGGGGPPGGGGGPRLGGGMGFDVYLLKEEGQWRVRSVRNHPPDPPQGQQLSDEAIEQRSRVWDYENPSS